MGLVKARDRLVTLSLMLAVGAFTVGGACEANTGAAVQPTTAPARTAKAEQAAPTAEAEEAALASEVEKAASAPAAMQTDVFRVGETVEVQDHTLTVLSVEQQGGRLRVEVQINNTGTEDLIISSILLFAARDSSGEDLEFSFGPGIGSVDGTVLPNDKLKGTLEYKLPAGATGLRLYYTPGLFGEGAIVFALDAEAEQNPFAVPPELADPQEFSRGTVYAVGDAVASGDVVAAMVEARVAGRKLTATFVIHNVGDDDLNVSSIISFEAKDGEGEKGAFSFTLDGQLDGKVLPGDSLRGNVQWEFAAAPVGAKVYFKPELIGGDTIVWAVD